MLIYIYILYLNAAVPVAGGGGSTLDGRESWARAGGRALPRAAGGGRGGGTGDGPGRRRAPRLWPEGDIPKAFLIRIIHSANIDTDKGGTPL